jgi:hypothetical protein
MAKRGKAIIRTATRPIIREVYNSDDRAAYELAVHEGFKPFGPNMPANGGVPVGSIIGTRIKGSPGSGAINPPSNTKYV